MELTDAQFHRYARHLILDEVGEEGQEKLLHARVLVVGAGGLGSPVLLYLAAAGIGTIGIVDDDKVDMSNLQRQIAHTTDRIGELKVKSALETAAGINPEVRVIPYALRLTAANARELIEDYDLVVDGSDNFATRYLVNDACYFARKTVVAAALLRFEGQLSTFKPHLGHAHPCYRCLFPAPPPADLVPRCEQAGILGSIAGVLGTLQATETIKEVLGLGDGLSGRLVIYDALSAEFRKIAFPRDPACALCGPQATIRDLSIHVKPAPAPTG
jgi:adenylyltransferase/sulfurtransferase